MKFIQSGDQYDLYDDSVRSFDKLPAGTYTVEHDPRRGCYLMDHTDMKIEEKSYGVQESKIQKVINTYKRFDRSLGVILSGDKGIGKTMFAKKLCIQIKEYGIPIILVEEFHPGLVRFIEKIDQECLVLFDEFDKTFSADNDSYDDDDDYDNSDKEGQARLLSLFDGTSVGKKLFIVTCNDLRGLNDCLLNRPGRFHYHFRFDYPSDSEIREYMNDKLDEKYHGEIPKIITLSKKVNLNYDCLRAIAFELNGGTEFFDAISDLNIINTDEKEYDITLRFTNGKEIYRKRYSIDLFDDEDDREWINLYFSTGKFAASVAFSKSALEFDNENEVFVIDRRGIYIDEDEMDSSLEKATPSALIFAKSKAKNIHFFG
jgi:hypothetical protein